MGTVRAVLVGSDHVDTIKWVMSLVVYAAVYGHLVTDGRSKKRSGWVSFGLPDDRKS